MARLPYVDPSTAPEAVRNTLAGLPADLKIFRMLAHAETNVAPLLALGTSILTQQKLDHRLRELAILRVAKLSSAPYEWVQHVPIAELVGASKEEIAALDRGEIEAACFDAKAQCVLRFATEVTEDVKASQAAFDDVAKFLDATEIVELIVAVGFYMMMARVMESTEIDLDDPMGKQVIEGAQRAADRREG